MNQQKNIVFLTCKAGGEVNRAWALFSPKVRSMYCRMNTKFEKQKMNRFFRDQARKEQNSKITLRNVFFWVNPSIGAFVGLTI